MATTTTDKEQSAPISEETAPERSGPQLPYGVGSVTSGWLTFLFIVGLIALTGFVAWLIQLQYGEVVTGLRDIGTMQGAPWGLYIAFVVFFVGVSFAGISTAVLIRLLDLEKLRPVARMAELLTIVSLLMATIAIVADLGQPFRGLINLFRYARPQSPFFGTFSLVISGYLVASVIYFYLDSRKDAKECAARESRLRWLYRGWAAGYKGTEEEVERHRKASFWLSIAILPLLVIAHSTLGFVFGLQVGRPGWYSALQAPSFVIMAGISGVGLLIVAAAVLRRVAGDDAKDRLNEGVFGWLGKFLMVLIIIYTYFMIVDMLTAMYTGGHHEVRVSDAILKGRYAWLYWSAVITLILPLGILIWQAVKRQWAIGLLVTCGVLVNITAILKRYLLVVPSETAGTLLPYQPGTYSPSVVEYLLVAGLMGLALTMIAIFMKVFPIMELPADEADEANENVKESSNA